MGPFRWKKNFRIIAIQYYFFSQETKKQKEMTFVMIMKKIVIDYKISFAK